MPPGATTIAFDVMGSDHGPAEVVRGAAALSLETKNVHALLVGDAQQIDQVLAETRHSGERISVHHAPDFVGMHEKPSEALGRTPRASILVATQLVADGEADAVVTAGNTGGAAPGHWGRRHRSSARWLALGGGTSAATRRRKATGAITRCVCPVAEGRFIR